MSREIAYFTMEIGLEPGIKTYSGGLGILAGDTVKTAADHGLNFYAVTLLYRNGFFQQKIQDQKQVEKPQQWNYTEKLEDLGVQTSIELRDRTVDVKIWRKKVEGEKGDAEVLFLDTGLDSNTEEDRELTSRLYMGDRETRLCQEALLGIAGVKAVNALDRNPDYFHMNEGHSALLVTETDRKKVFTTHTPVAAGHDTFNTELVQKVLPESRVKGLELEEELNMTELALENSSYRNAVSDIHKEVTEKMFPEYSFDAVTNGIHTPTWASEPFKQLFDRHVSRWRIDPSRLTKIAGVKTSKVWEAKKKSKEELGELIQDREGPEFDQEKFTVGFARRSTGYKRPALIFKDIERLEKIAGQNGGLQLVYAGKAHPEDTEGKKLIKKVLTYSDMLENVEIFFIENYGMNEALKVVSGCDLWLNNPERGKEASGTSGMKAAANGTPQLSTMDGWWPEGHIEGVTGWSIGEEYVEGEDEDRIDSASIYKKMEKIMSIYRNERKDWIKIIKNSIALNASRFNTDTMLKEYLARAYK
ncbi:MAG: alpha-glucan family phosphorylase [Candidatus Nanohalobium sp.]